MSYLSSSSVVQLNRPRSARKQEKYAALAFSHTFIPIAIETMGSIGSKASSFLQELDRRLSVTTGNPRESAFLFLRLSVALQCVFVGRLVLFRTMILIKRVWLSSISHHWYNNPRVSILISATVYCFATIQ